MSEQRGTAVLHRFGQSAGHMVPTGGGRGTNRDQTVEALKKQLGPEIMDLISDHSLGISDVWVNPDGEVWKVQQGVRSRHGLRLIPEYVRQIINLAAELGGKVANRDEPIVETALPWGQRFEGMLDHVVNGGPTFSIRVHSREAFTLQSYLDTGRCSPLVMEMLTWALEARQNIVVCGETGSGKTSLVDAMFGHPALADLRIMTVEETAELKLEHVADKVRGVVDPRMPQAKVVEGIRQITRAGMRMRPDVLLLGEVRGGEVVEWVKALYAGHSGGMLTMHADHPEDAMDRLDMMLGEVIADTRSWRRRLIRVVERIVWVRRHKDGGGKIAGIYKPTLYDDRTGRFHAEVMAGLPLHRECGKD